MSEEVVAQIRERLQPDTWLRKEGEPFPRKVDRWTPDGVYTFAPFASPERRWGFIPVGCTHGDTLTYTCDADGFSLTMHVKATSQEVTIQYTFGDGL